jgi:glutaconyl-CoA/methylmalonyl-CoA decarboxylase subunit gamma
MKVEAVVRGVSRLVDADALDDATFVVRDGDSRLDVRVDRVCGGECWRLVVDGVAVPVRIRSTDTGADIVLGPSRVAVDLRRALPIPSRRTGASGGTDRVEVRAPMPGLVVAIPRSQGESVDAGTSVAVVEAMKMQMDVPAPTAGRIDEIRVRLGQEVMGGQVLVAIRSDGVVKGERV